MNIIKKINKYQRFLIFIFIVLILIILFADFVAPYNPLEGKLKNAFLPPNREHIFGTDKLGRDIFSRVIHGVRISLGISLTLISSIFFVGLILGIISGYIGGKIDIVIMRITDILISCPTMILAIALAGIAGASIKNAMITIFVVTIGKYIRLTRSLVIKIKNEEYIKAAKIIGTTDRNILSRHILPNIFQTLLITASTDIGIIILELSALSFLGFGVPAPIPELGLMINEGRNYMMYSPWMLFFPGIALFLIVSFINLISDELRDLIW